MKTIAAVLFLGMLVPVVSVGSSAPANREVRLVANGHHCHHTSGIHENCRLITTKTKGTGAD